MALPHFLAAVRPHPAPVARYPAGVPGERAGICFAWAAGRRISRGLVLSLCLGLWRPLHPGLPDRPPAGPTTGRDARHPRVPAGCDDRVLPEWVVRPLHCNPDQPRLHPVWQLALAATAVDDRSVGHHLFDELAGIGSQLGLGAGLCLAPGARRDRALRRPAGPGAAVWRRAPGPVPRTSQHGAGRRDQPFSSDVRSKRKATLPTPLADHAGAVLREATPAERQAFAQVLAQTSAPINDELFAQSLQEARAGAKIIVWSEGAAGVLQEDEASLLTRASAFTRTTGTYLDMGVFELLVHPVQTQSLLMPSRYVLDESILIDPNGNVVWRYEKTHPVFLGDFSVVPGNGKVPTVQTPYGRLSTVICWDADFPSTPRQAGQAGADIMLIPGNDPQADDPYHTQVTTFRAIENGYSLVRQASNSLAMTVDYEGHVLAASDYFTSDPQVMIAYVPVQGVRTIYATIGDLFAWLSIAGLVVLIGVAIARRRKAGEAGVAAPITASPSSGEPIEAVPTEAVLTEPRPPSREPISSQRGRPQGNNPKPRSPERRYRHDE